MSWLPVAVLGAVWLPHAVRLWRADIAEHRLPNRLTASFALWTAAAGIAVALVAGDLSRLGFAALAAAVTGAAALVLALLPPGVLGMGDAKLAPTVAFQCALLGWEHLLGGMLGTLLTAGAAGIWLLLAQRVGAGDRIAFGPFLLLAYPASVLLADPVRGALLL